MGIMYLHRAVVSGNVINLLIKRMKASFEPFNLGSHGHLVKIFTPGSVIPFSTTSRAPCRAGLQWDCAGRGAVGPSPFSRWNQPLATAGVRVMQA